MQTFTIQQIRNYIQSQDSIGDVLYNLSEEAILDANQTVNTDSEAYREGRDEYVSGKKLFNPYNQKYIEYKEYEAGWFSKFYEDEELL
jgi:hypothetical protein